MTLWRPNLVTYFNTPSWVLTRDVFIIHTRYLYILKLKNSHKKSRIGKLENLIILTSILSLPKIRAQCLRDQWLTDTIIIVSQGTYPTRVFTGYVHLGQFVSWNNTSSRNFLFDYSYLGCPTSSSKSIGISLKCLPNPPFFLHNMKTRMMCLSLPLI